MSRNKKFGLTGLIIGVLVFAFDYDFFLNPAGPATPISDFIRNILALNNLEYPLNVIIPGLILALLGFFIGILIATLVTRSDISQ